MKELMSLYRYIIKKIPDSYKNDISFDEQDIDIYINTATYLSIARHGKKADINAYLKSKKVVKQEHHNYLYYIKDREEYYLTKAFVDSCISINCDMEQIKMSPFLIKEGNVYMDSTASLLKHSLLHTFMSNNTGYLAHDLFYMCKARNIDLKSLVKLYIEDYLIYLYK